MEITHKLRVSKNNVWTSMNYTKTGESNIIEVKYKAIINLED
jgi:hypothetical protein